MDEVAQLICTKLIIGLGNTGRRYAKNRHNIGFNVIDAIAEALNHSCFSSKFSGELCVIKLKDDLDVMLFKPSTFMNNSGKSVAEIQHFYKIPLRDTIVIHDDLDLTLGHIRFKINGGDGGHNGIKSIDQYIGKEYTRLRFGIGRPNDKRLVTDYVLGNFLPSDEQIAKRTINIIAENAYDLANGKFDAIANKCNNFMPIIEDHS